MEQKELIKMLEGIKSGAVEIDEAVKALKMEPFEDIGYAKVDHHRGIRQGIAEVIYGAGKTGEQILGIAQQMHDSGVKTILITRMNGDKASFVEKNGHFSKYRYEEIPRIGIIGDLPECDGIGTIVIASGGTSDMAVAEEAALTAQALGNEVVRLYDIVLDPVSRPVQKIDVPEDPGEAELVLILQIASVAPLKNKDRQKVVSLLNELRHVELRRVVGDLAVADIGPVQPDIEAGINPLEIQEHARRLGIPVPLKSMEIGPAGIVLRDIGRIKGKRIADIGVLLAVISAHLP